jgi:hypothetical protein
VVWIEVRQVGKTLIDGCLRARLNHICNRRQHRAGKSVALYSFEAKPRVADEISF